jgi:hypothetical protein
MRVLVACEHTGVVRDAFLRAGHDAWSCDLLPTDAPGPHLQGDVLDFLGDGWDLMVAHPPCQYLCSSGLHWNRRRPERANQTEAALSFVVTLMAAPIERIAIENPIGCISTRIMAATQTIQPYQFGHDASKATQLWLFNLPPLDPLPRGEWIAPRMISGKPRWGNQTDSGQNRLGPSADRWKLRSATYSGIAAAMAAQWTGGPMKQTQIELDKEAARRRISSIIYKIPPAICSAGVGKTKEWLAIQQAAHRALKNPRSTLPSLESSEKALREWL